MKLYEKSGNVASSFILINSLTVLKQVAGKVLCRNQIQPNQNQINRNWAGHAQKFIYLLTVICNENLQNSLREGTLKIIQSNSLVMGRDIQHQNKLVRASSKLALNTSRCGASPTPLGILFQCITTFSTKIFFLISNPKLFSFSFKPFTLVLSLHGKKFLATFPIGSLQVL